MFFFILQLSFSVVLLKILSKKLTLNYTIFPFLTHHQWAHQPDYFFLLWNKHGEPWSSFIKSSIRNVILARSIIFYWSVRSNNCNNRGRSVEPTSMYYNPTKSFSKQPNPNDTAPNFSSKYRKISPKML